MVSTTELFAGRFRLGTLLGQGGMSDVYRAVDDTTGEPVALKIVRSGDPELARRLTQEVKVHQRMEHEGLIRLLDTGVAGGQAFIVMELVDGATLAASLRGGPLGARLTAKLGGILGAALAYVHAEGIVHRDVKPSNILLSADGRALLGDFGIARVLDATTFTIDGTTIGTVAYMAPEQLEDHSVGPAADIWSLGIVLLECLIGRRVYEGSSSEIIARRLAGPVPLPGDLPVPWKLLLSGMLDHRPEQRLNGTEVASMLSSPTFAEAWSPSPPDTETERRGVTQPLDLTALAPERAGGMAAAAERVDALAATAVGRPTPPTEATQIGVPPAMVPRRAQRGGRGWGWLVALVIVALLAGAGAVAYAVWGGTTPPATTGHSGEHTTTTTTSTSTTTTTTTLPSAPTALGSLVSDLTTAVESGTVSPNIGQQLTTAAQQAISDESTGQPDQAAADLQRAATVIANGLQNNTIDQTEAATLQNDLTTLASSLGLSAAAATPPTTLPGPTHPHHGAKGGG